MSVSYSNVELDRSAFDAIAALAHREFGLHIAPEKMKMVQSRLRHRLGELNISDFDTYSKLVCSEQGSDERRSMISALTTNVSHFFREPHHFEMLSEFVLPSVKDIADLGGRIRIWSAGCSNGQEPYSIAMHMLDSMPSLASADFKILATDVDPKVVDFASHGKYSAKTANGILPHLKSKFAEQKDDGFQISQNIRNQVTFRELNLLSDWPMRFQFDAIFCRNVVIYFDLETQENLWPRFHKMLKPGGLLFLGHSERITSPSMFGFRTIGTTTYQKHSGTEPQLSIASGGTHGTS